VIKINSHCEMKFIEGTHYLRRIDQPSPHLPKSKEFVDCLICRLPSDSENEEVRTALRRRHVKVGIRLDKFSQHFKAKHKCEYALFSSSQVNGASVEVGSSDRIAAATAKFKIRRRGPLTVSPQVYSSNLEP
jgi:hypothetical protein